MLFSSKSLSYHPVGVVRKCYAVRHFAYIYGKTLFFLFPLL